MAGLDELAFRESVFAWLRARMLTQESFSRDELSEFPLNGRTHRLVGTQTGIWKIKDLSPAAISILTAYVPEGLTRPYDDSVGADGMLRYKWRGWAVESLGRGVSEHSMRAAAVWSSGAMVARYTRARSSELAVAEFSRAWRN